MNFARIDGSAKNIFKALWKIVPRPLAHFLFLFLFVCFSELLMVFGFRSILTLGTLMVQDRAKQYYFSFLFSAAFRKSAQ